MKYKTYADKLKHPLWQKKRLEILQRDNWICQSCMDTSTTLNVHHKIYLPDKDIWDYPDYLLITLCDECHLKETQDRVRLENDLLSILRQKYLYDDLYLLAQSFIHLDLNKPHDFSERIVKWIFSNKDVYDDIFKLYMTSHKYILTKKCDNLTDINCGLSEKRGEDYV